jgi:hypothetical protein
MVYAIKIKTTNNNSTLMLLEMGIYSCPYPWRLTYQTYMQIVDKQLPVFTNFPLHEQFIPLF